jgi:hypothetical protein
VEEPEHWHWQGPVVRGERTATHSTTDQRLLESRGATDWVHTDPWRVLRIQAEFIDGFGTLAELGPAVSVFGSARTPRDHPMYAAAERLGGKLARAGLAVITGGGPGIMEAANKGAAEVRGGLGRSRHRAAVRVRPQPLRQPGHQFSVLLRAQDDVRQVRPRLWCCRAVSAPWMSCSRR